MDRRQLLKLLSGAGAASALGHPLQPALANAPVFDDYKALVVVFLLGGNDAYNMIVPMGDESADAAVGTGYQTYRNSRGHIAIEPNDLRGLSGNPYAAENNAAAYQKGVYPVAGDIGINGVMPELAALYQNNQAAVIANLGTLIEPVTKATRDSAALPPFLFAHNHQQRAMETGWADHLSAGGWAGRIADMWQAHALSGVNNNSPLGLNVSYGGATRMMTGDFNSPVVLSPGSTRIFDTSRGFDPDTFRAMNAANSADSALSRVLKASYRKTSDLNALMADQFQLTLDFSDLSDPYGNPLFSTPDAEQLQLTGRMSGRTLSAARDVARMIQLGRNVLGLNRQVFFIGMGGFDNHSELTTYHPLLLRELSLTLGSFQQAMNSLGIADEVSLCTLSDFARTLGNNGDGTDHAWASHHLVTGGAVNGGQRYGNIPDLTLDGEADVGRTGRLIPDLAMDQYLATLTRWFGVDDADMATLFPNLANFKAVSSDPISSAYINGLFTL